MDGQRFYLGKELSTIFRVRPATISRWRQAGVLPAVRFGRAWLFPADAVEQALARQGHQTDQAVEEVPAQ
jgi:excisionase family DNA binding protein